MEYTIPDDMTFSEAALAAAATAQIQAASLAAIGLGQDDARQGLRPGFTAPLP